jgi:tetratricopeptide (TPR) repeat protein
MRVILIFAICLPCTLAQETETPTTEQQRRRTAVTLNYCRASLSRIRRYPSKRILLEEQERILNNLDLNAIRDEEVINLYSAVLDEINQTQILETERRVIHERTRRGMQRKLGTDLFVIGAHAVTGQLGNAIQSGANSWWDYRNTSIDRDAQTWVLERTKINGIVERSSKFLDAAWKLSRRNEIPDRWLVRTDDLSRLQKAMHEPDPAVRLRVLQRMSRFMEAYPPYWYYVARTQQQMGQLQEAAKTFRQLVDLGNGHFRKDDMLAAGTANLAMIEEYLESPTATRTAKKALEYSTDSWEVNLTCAWVLNRHDAHSEAEDAILRNLDVELEEHQSAIALTSLYYHTGDSAKLAKLLSDETVVARIPIPGLLLSATLLADDKFPAAARRRVVSSIRVDTDRRFGRESLVVSSAPDWKLGDAQLAMQIGDARLEPPRITTTPRGAEARFAGRLDSDVKNFEVTLTYPNTPAIRLHFATTERRGPLPTVDLLKTADRNVTITAIEVGKKRLSMEFAPSIRR